MPTMSLPIAAASQASEFPTLAVAIVAALILTGLGFVAFIDYKRTRQKRRDEEGQGTA